MNPARESGLILSACKDRTQAEPFRGAGRIDRAHGLQSRVARLMPQGHLPWHSDEMDQYANHFDYGTKARLAFELLLQLGQSKCDIVRIGPQHVKDGMLVFSRKKTGVEFTCEILPPLRTAIEAMGKPKAINGVVPLTFLVTEQGKPFSANGFSASPVKSRSPGCFEILP